MARSGDRAAARRPSPARSPVPAPGRAAASPLASPPPRSRAPAPPQASGSQAPGSQASRVRHAAPERRERDARARRSIGRLHGAMLSLIEERAFAGITVDDIVARSGVSRPTFYRYYATKQALLDDIAIGEIERLVEVSVPLLGEGPTLACAIEVAGQVDQHRRLWGVLLTGGASATMREHFIELAMSRGQAHLRRFPDGVPIELGARWGVAATFEILAWWLRQAEPLPVAAVAALIDRLAVRPAL